MGWQPAATQSFVEVLRPCGLAVRGSDKQAWLVLHRLELHAAIGTGELMKCQKKP